MLKLNTKSRYLLLSVAAGILLSIPWYDFGSGMVLLFGFLPLLYLVDTLPAGRKKPGSGIAFYTGIMFALWGILGGWWLSHATFAGTVFLAIIHTFFYTILTLLYHSVKARLGKVAGYFALVSFWVAFEYWFLNAELSVPWFNLGNGLSHDIRMIQWFEYTGGLGGTVWILICNILLYESLRGLSTKRVNRALVISYAFVLLVPIIFSLLRFMHYQETGEKINVLAIQPNIDPYEKFISYTTEQQVDIILDLAASHLSENLDYLITPETTITSYTDVDALGTTRLLEPFRQLLADYPDMNIILGMTLSKTYDRNEPVSETARQTSRGYFMDTYNSAVQLNRCSVQVYHKSKLFPGVEAMPYANSLKFLHKLMIRLGGTFRSHGISPERINLASCNEKVNVAPVICWENVYGEFTTGFVKNGANVIFNITNEGWWGDTPGHKMFKKYAQVRAIETRRSVVRSANTGISAIIDQRGVTLDRLTWDIKGSVKGSVRLNDCQTFYTRHEDYIGKILRIPALGFLLALAVFFIRDKIRGTGSRD